MAQRSIVPLSSTCLIRLEAVADRLAVSRHAIRRAIQAGAWDRCPPPAIRGPYRWREADVTDFITRMEAWPRKRPKLVKVHD